MYYPYFRGKQNELLTIRECTKLMKQQNFIPVIEPVKQSLSALERALGVIKNDNGNAIVIINPSYGDHSKAGEEISCLLTNSFNDCNNIEVGILLKKDLKIDEVNNLISKHNTHRITFIHDGFTDANSIIENNLYPKDPRNIFIEGQSGKLYQKKFSDGEKILIRDGFQRRRNKDHPETEFFSDLHATYKDEGMQGFGDFLIVGDDFSEAGGPAYAVAIHLTFIDKNLDGAMYVDHFISDRQDTPTDPAGKFLEAVKKLINKINSENHNFYETLALNEFRELNERRHFPGLGYLKKLSMNHHIQTLSKYLGNQ